MEVAKSLPFAGPRPIAISLRWRSLADQSFMIVSPATNSQARSTSTFAHSLPITTAASSSKSSAPVSGGTGTVSSGPIVAAGLEK